MSSVRCLANEILCWLCAQKGHRYCGEAKQGEQGIALPSARYLFSVVSHGSQRLRMAVVRCSGII